MAGFGERFTRAGFMQPKPLVPIDGVSMIERVIKFFPQDSRFIFCINKTHAETTDLLSVLERVSPEAIILAIDPHRDGPVRTLLACEGYISEGDEVIVNYCDVGIDWNYEEFETWLRKGKWDGAMTAYRGFHPHSLGPTLYAYMKTEGERVTEIREKHHFTDDKFSEFASAGLYYFKRGGEMLKIARALVASGDRVHGEFYVSMAIQRMIESGGSVGVFPLQRFFQWGTPEDLRDYESWARAMRELDTYASKIALFKAEWAQIIPMAGRGVRFSSRGYADPKPFIDTGGAPMITQALSCLPIPQSCTLIALKEHCDHRRFPEIIERFSETDRVVRIDEMTEGQACTAMLGLSDLKPSLPVLIGTCDTGYIYDPEKLKALYEEAGWDLIVFAAKDYLQATWRPAMYGWMSVREDGSVRRIAVKTQVEGEDPFEQQVITGTFLFKNVAAYLQEYRALLEENDRVNGEFYIDTIARRMVDAGKRVVAFTVTKYIPWGTPEELMTFQYWNEVFREGRAAFQGWHGRAGL